MTTLLRSTDARSTDARSTDARTACATRVHDAECALHDARATGSVRWIAAAAARLHEAVTAYRRSLAADRAA